MAVDFVTKTTPDVNAFEHYYRAHSEYKERKNIHPALVAEEESKKNIFTNANEKLAKHKDDEDGFISNIRDNFRSNRKLDIKKKADEKIAKIDRQIKSCKDKIENTKTGGKGKDVLFNNLMEQKTKELAHIKTHTKKAEQDLNHFGRAITPAKVQQAVEGARAGVYSALSYNYMNNVVRNAPPDYFAPVKKQRKSPINMDNFKKIWSPSFFDRRRINTFRNMWIYRVILLGALAALIYLGVTTGVLFILLGAAAVVGVCVMFVPGILVMQKLKKGAPYYYVVINHESLIEKLIQLEIDDEVKNEKSRIEADKRKLEAELATLNKEKEALTAERDKQIKAINDGDIEKFAKNEYTKVLAGLKKETEAAEDALKIAKNRREENNKNIKKFTDAVQTIESSAKETPPEERDPKDKTPDDTWKARTSYVGKIMRWCDIEKADKVYRRNGGRVWDALYLLDDKQVDENKAFHLEKLSHTMKPKALLYECDSITPASEMSGFIMLMGAQNKRMYPDNLLNLYVVETSGNAAAYGRVAGTTMETIGQVSQIKRLIDTITDVQNVTSKSDIAQENARRIKEGLAPYPYTIAFIFIPSSEDSASSGSDVLPKDLRQQIVHKGRYGFMPIFIIDKKDWVNASDKGTGTSKVVYDIKRDYVDAEDVHMLNYRNNTISKI